MMILLLQLLCLSTMVTNAFVIQPSTTRTSPESSSFWSAILQAVPPYVAMEHCYVASESPTVSLHSSTISLQSYVQKWLQGQHPSLAHSNLYFVEPANAAETPTTGSVAAVSPPTKQEVALLREAFAAFYGTTDRDPTKALDLLSQALDAWQRQPADERAGLYRVRGDCYMALERPNDAIADYGVAIDLLRQPGVLEAADPVELPASL
jgi:hypothetical protein